jgi:hypothetical protein
MQKLKIIYIFKISVTVDVSVIHNAHSRAFLVPCYRAHSKIYIIKLWTQKNSMTFNKV